MTERINFTCRIPNNVGGYDSLQELECHSPLRNCELPSKQAAREKWGRGQGADSGWGATETLAPPGQPRGRRGGSGTSRIRWDDGGTLSLWFPLHAHHSNTVSRKPCDKSPWRDALPISEQLSLKIYEWSQSGESPET